MAVDADPERCGFLDHLFAPGPRGRERSFEGQTIMGLLSQERFDQAETYAQVRERIIAGGGRQAHALAYGEWAAQNVAADYSAFSSLDQPLNVLVLSEDWCPDCTD